MQSSGVHALVLGDQQSQDKGLLVKDQHYAWTLGAVFNLKKPPLGWERRLLLARLLLAVVGKEGEVV